MDLEFANELLAEDNEEEEDEYDEEEEERDDEYEFNESGEDEEAGNAVRHESGTKIGSAHKNKAFRHESHNIILNLSKNTLRNILMLVCDEGVCKLIFFS